MHLNGYGWQYCICNDQYVIFQQQFLKKQKTFSITFSIKAIPSCHIFSFDILWKYHEALIFWPMSSYCKKNLKLLRMSEKYTIRNLYEPKLDQNGLNRLYVWIIQQIFRHINLIHCPLVCSKACSLPSTFLPPGIKRLPSTKSIYHVIFGVIQCWPSRLKGAI